MSGVATGSLKRLAWAYGCAKKGSDEERRLLELLERVERHITALRPDEATRIGGAR